MLGLSEVGNNWKFVVANFIIVFGVQLIFSLNDLLQGLGAWSDTTSLEIVKIFGASLVTALIFYGYNKQAKPSTTEA